VIRGRLTTGSGRPIGNARIQLLATQKAPGAVPADKGGARTRADGAFTLILPSDVSSRTLDLRYRSHSNDPNPVAQQRLTLKVRAGIALAVARGGRTARFSGRLQGRPVPRRGKVVELQARVRGTARWITFRSVRTDAAGRFGLRYTFRFPGRRVTYEFRARSRFESGYPYESGASRVLRVRTGS
jgi:hypothetical protein